MDIRIEQKTAVSVLGTGRSGMAIIEHLALKGVRVYAFDDGVSSPAVRERLAALGIPLYEEGEGELRGEVVFRSPAVRPDAPRLCRAALRGARILTEAEYFLSLCPAPVFAVTGSDGKTTTASLLAALLARSGRRVFLGGNIGNSLLPVLPRLSREDLCVMELSSFQLSDMEARVYCGIITNLTPNHLNWHRDMAEYTAAKKRLLGMAEHRVLREGLFPEENAVRFCAEQKSDYTAENGLLLARGIPLCRADEVRLCGKHNIENLLAAAAAAEAFVTPADVRFVARSFSGVPHRMEWLGEKKGVGFYNSSIDTTPDRTAVTLRALPKNGRRILLLCGGKGKGLSFSPLAAAAKQAAARAYVFGAAREEIAAAFAENDMPCVLCGSMQKAFAEAFADAERGDLILLSPACTSFDAFADFEERGACFRELVAKI